MKTRTRDRRARTSYLDWPPEFADALTTYEQTGLVRLGPFPSRKDAFALRSQLNVFNAFLRNTADPLDTAAHHLSTLAAETIIYITSPHAGEPHTRHEPDSDGYYVIITLNPGIAAIRAATSAPRRGAGAPN